ncbi:MAG: hypothetical protein A2Y15_02735 [Clostridiales bacterium GWF2_36_10]|nr:MAG: hypothetical protein A2Y15_02735 [Clostridiales bacterium GWF2_36_10]HAN21134.1 radical SAM protein [Clostridiales bacterium]
MKNHCNIPFFIPHSGCNNNCVFCSQVKITGKNHLEPNLDQETQSLIQTIENSLSTLSEETETQLAFFGGSFTGIERNRMISLLETGYDYVKKGKIKGIRISTRPDYINQEILDILKTYGVTDIELGIQSMNDRVLKECARGHISAISYKSSELIIKNGFNFVGQMMIGLPLSTIVDELETADAIIKMGATAARIYPTVVFSDTVLYNMTKDGLYKPLTNDQAIERCALCCDRFIKAGIKVLKIGLHSSESLTEAEFGANHPALGELVKSKIYFHRISEELDKLDCVGKTVQIFVKSGEQSKLTGHGGKILNELKEKYNLLKIETGITDTEENQPIIKIKE